MGQSKKNKLGRAAKEPGLRIRDRDLKALVYAAASNIHGTGLFAARRIEKGEYIGTYHGPRAKRNGVYVLWIYPADGEETGISGRNLLRFLNHARPPNAELDGPDLYARRVIARGREITFDYGPDW